MIVLATPGLLQNESVEIKDVIQNQQVADLPLKDREFLQLAMLSEGVVNPPGGTRGDSLQQTGRLINVLGQRTGHNLFLVDGVSATDEYFNNVVVSPSPDDTAEFMIDKTNYGAEFGGKSGGVMNIITKSGTDHLHGSAQRYLQCQKLLRSARPNRSPLVCPPAFRHHGRAHVLCGLSARSFHNLEHRVLHLRSELS